MQQMSRQIAWTLVGTLCCLFLTQPISAISGCLSDDACFLDDSPKQQDAALLQVKSMTKESESFVPSERQQEALMSTFAQEISCAGCAQSRGIGLTADLNPTGFGKVQKACCSKEMAAFIERLIVATRNGDGVCYRGDLMGMAIWYDCPADGLSGRDFAALQDSIGPNSKAVTGDCPWIGPLSACPEKDASCPTFPEAENPTPCGEDAPPPPFCSGTSSPTDWTDYNGKGVKIDVDTSMCNFTSAMKPIYVTSLGGGDNGAQAWTTGGSAVYKTTNLPFEKGFRIYILTSDSTPVTVQEALNRKWHVNWIAHTTGLTAYPTATSCAGATEVGNTAWNYINEPRSGLEVAIDTTACGFSKRPVYQVAIRGITKIWRCRMGIDLDLLQANKFRTSIEYNAGARPDADPNDPGRNWHMTYVAHPDELVSYPGGSSCAGETGNDGWEVVTKPDGTVRGFAVKRSVDTSKCKFTTIPIYVSTLLGSSSADGQMFRTRGGNAIYKPAEDRFEVIVSCHKACTPDDAEAWGWRVGWMAVTKDLAR